MKKKELMYLLFAVALLAVTGVILYGQLKPSKGGRQATVEVISPMTADFDQEALDQLTNPASSRNFTPPVDFSNGMGNPRPFTPL
jgi:hypothetical protein